MSRHTGKGASALGTACALGDAGDVGAGTMSTISSGVAWQAGAMAAPGRSAGAVPGGRDETVATIEPRLLNPHYSGETGGDSELVAGLALGGSGIAAAFAGRSVGARLGQAGLGRGLGIALGIGALAGAAFLIHRSAQNRSEEYLVHFAAQPDFTGVAPGDVYDVLRAHHERHAPAVEQVLDELVAEQKVRGYSGIIGSNGFVVDVVRRHADEVRERLDAVVEVGDVSAAPL